jgi:L,D-transpeptidase ErfK/SrfK
VRDYDSPNSSSRVIWGVAGVAGLLLLAWASGWLPFDFGGTDTGQLVDDPVTAQFEELQSQPFESLPEQHEPATTRIVDVPAAGGEDMWNVTEPAEAAAPPPAEEIETVGFEPSIPAIPEIPNAAPPEIEAGPFTGERFTAAKPVGDPLGDLSSGAWQADPTPGGRPERFASAEPSPYELTRAEAPAAAPPVLDLATIDGMIRDGALDKAHAALSRIWFEHPGARETIRRRIDGTARAVFFDPQPHFMPAYTVVSGDTLGRIGQEYGVPWQYIVRLNRVDPQRIRPGDELKVVKGPFHAHVELESFTLTVHNHGLYVKQYAIGIGRDGRTPVGDFTVRDKVVNPSYTDPEGRVMSGDDPRNPIGERWLSLGSGYGIHGTLNPESIGRSESAGCVRLLNADVAELFDLLGVGSEVVISR